MVVLRSDAPLWVRMWVRLLAHVTIVWDETRYREIYGVGMICVALVMVMYPEGTIAQMQRITGVSVPVIAIWWAVSGYLLARYGHRGGVARWLYSLPIVIYVAFTISYMQWRIANGGPVSFVPAVMYMMSYITLLKVISSEGE